MRNNKNQNIYKQMQRFADVTKTLITQGNIDRAKHCLQIAEDIFNKGTLEIKNAVSNVYLYSVSSFMEMNNINVRPLLPFNLEKEYVQQVNASGL